MSSVIIPGDGSEENVTIGQQITAFFKEEAKGALIGFVLSGRFLHWGGIAGIVIGSVRAGYELAKLNAPKSRINMEEDYESVFEAPVNNEIRAHSDTTEVARDKTRLGRHFHHGVEAGNLAPAELCYKFCDRIGEKRPDMRKMCKAKILYHANRWATNWDKVAGQT